MATRTRILLGLLFALTCFLAILPAFGAEKTVAKPPPKSKATFHFEDRTVSCEYSTMTVYSNGTIVIRCSSVPIVVMK